MYKLVCEIGYEPTKCGRVDEGDDVYRRHLESKTTSIIFNETALRQPGENF